MIEIESIKTRNVKYYYTNEYDKFKFAEWNRKLKKSTIAKMKRAITEFGYDEEMPILVNEKFEVIDGQNRLMACKELGVGFWFKVAIGYGRKDAIRINADTSKWTLQDYIISYSSKDVDEDIRINYERLKDLMVEYGQILDVSLCACYGNAVGRGTSNIQDGTLKIELEDYERARTNLEFVNRFSDFTTFFGGNKRTTLCTLIKLKFYNLIDEDRMVEQFEKYGNRYISTNDMLGTLESLDEIYNTNRKIKEHFVDKFKSLIGE